MDINSLGFFVIGICSGPSAAKARRLVAQGAHMLPVDLQREGVEALTAELGPRARFSTADVAYIAGAEVDIEEFRANFEPRHVLVNCAGLTPPEEVVGRDGPHRLETVARTLQINLVGGFNTLRLATAAILELASDVRRQRRGWRDHQHGFRLGLRLPSFIVARIEDKMGRSASDTTQVLLENRRVTADRLFGREGEGY